MTLVRVYTDIGGLKPVNLIAKIFEIRDSTFVIRYLSPTDEKRHGKIIYRYEDDTYEVGDESISKYMDTSDESDIGFRCVGEGMFVMSDSESDESEYEPGDSDDDDSESASDSDVPTDELSDGDDEEDEYWSDGN